METPQRLLSVPDSCGVHSAPPSIVLRMVPPSPTAQAVLASNAATPRRFLSVPDSCAFQVFPPSVVLRIVPWVPTTQTVRVSTAKTP